MRDARRDFARIVGDFADNGYLVEHCQVCVDDPDSLPDATTPADSADGPPHARGA
ncbi:hypothetical protein [Streptomyces sp. BPTC-684]|uniref:hypothetical protein n=1 Tax=Streptomyces sp. BPTC-684 TaxID=3043734 RepID=UPI0024B11AB2|nr:hypothetical protein [Streptomyces sp. BPTC-684]WHM41558.1 hypothetical protein QIY60_31720 [Streptomyces sp. BPTC-684]